MNKVQHVVDTIKELGYHVRPLELLYEINQRCIEKYGNLDLCIRSPLELDKILIDLYKDNTFIYNADGAIVWTLVTKKGLKSPKKSVPLK